MAHLHALARLGKDAEIRKIGNESVCNLALCYDRYDGATKTRIPQWIDAALWGKRAEALAQYLIKGARVVVMIEDPHIHQYQTRDGGTGHKLAGRVASIELAGSKSDAAPAPAPRPAPAPPAASGVDESDIPF